MTPTPTPTPTIDRQFVEDFLLSANGNLNARALEKHKITKEQAYMAYYNLKNPTQCKQCRNSANFISFKKGYTIFCSKACAANNLEIQNKKLNTVLEHYGPRGYKNPIIQDRKEKTNLKKYGVIHRRKDPLYIEQQKQSFTLKYGNKSPSWTANAIAKRKNTNQLKYKSEYPTSNPDIKEKVKKTNTDRYGVSTALLLSENRKSALNTRRDPEVYNQLNDAAWLANHANVPSTKMSTDLGVAFSTILNYYTKYQINRPITKVSRHEMALTDFLQANSIKYECNNRSILDGKEIDIFLPEYNIGIEVDGLYWHSETFKINKLYHIEKNKIAEKHNIQLLHITDQEIVEKFDIVKNRLLSKLNKSPTCYARQCLITDLPYNEFSKFMAVSHIQGAAIASHRYGLWHNDKLVAAMGFSKPRFNKNYQWELVRYSSINTVVGGASKLFSNFVRKLNPTSVISYSDNRWNTGNLYTALGMKYLHTTGPNYWYIVDGRLMHRSIFQKHKLKKILSIFDETKTESENMQINGYSRYWDCGNKTFIWEKQ